MNTPRPPRRSYDKDSRSPYSKGARSPYGGGSGQAPRPDPRGRQDVRPRDEQEAAPYRDAGAMSLAPRPFSPEPGARLPSVVMQIPTPHPLLYRKRIEHVDPGVKAGDWVAVYHAGDQLMGYGIYSPRAEIAVRMLRWGPEPPDDAFFESRLDAAIELRRDFLRLDESTDAYRVLHAESDGFSGLVVDRLGDTLSAEAFCPGMFQRAGAVLERLAAKLGTRHTLIRCSPQSLMQEGFDSTPIASPELPPRVTIQEYGTRFRVRFEGGHKTGFFCDQRENRKRLAEFCKGRSVLDLCCYTGGFSIQAKRLGEAADVTGVDLDAEPLKLAKENANLNQCRVNFVQADAFAYMRDMQRLGRQYDVVVLDPPKLITNRAEIEEGTRKHFDINRLAMQMVRPGGLLLTCTCAGLLPTEDFLHLLYGAARQAGPLDGDAVTANGKPRHLARNMQVLAKSGAAADHPVVTHCLETEYLKAVWLRME